MSTTESHHCPNCGTIQTGESVTYDCDDVWRCGYCGQMKSVAYLERNVIVDTNVTKVNDYPVVDNRPVTEAHAKICLIIGHASWKVDGVDKRICPRCGVRTK